MSETDSPETMLLKVGSNSAPQAVATAIYKSIFDSNVYPSLRAIGHGAVGQAVKAIAIARGHVAARAVDLGVTVGFDTIINNDGEEISAILFETFKRR